MPPSALSMSLSMSVPVPRGRVLCVDDEPNLLRSLSWLLQKEFEVLTAGSGAEGIEMVRGNDFDVVISDQRMPGMSGIEFLRQVRGIAPRAMRILLTGYADVEAVIRSVNESEIFRYVTKPWSVSELPRIVAQAAEIAKLQGEFPGDSPAAAVPHARVLVLDPDPAVHSLLAQSVGDLCEVVHANSVVDAVNKLLDGDFGILVAENRLDSGIDLTRLLCLLKQRHPRLVSVVLAEESAADDVTRLINSGQIYRFILKPVKAGYLRQVMRSALGKCDQLRRHPELCRRHAVEPLGDEDGAALAADLALARTLAKAPSLPDHAPTLAGRVGMAIGRLLGHAPR